MKADAFLKRRLFWGALALGFVVAAVAEAVIPLPGRTLQAIAKVNRTSARTQALQLEMKLRVGEEPPIAEAALISHPSGLARLEIRGYDGRVDRYLLSGGELSGTMNGRQLSHPRPLLQPLFLIQLGSESTLRTALEAFDIRTRSIGLAPCGDVDCFVLGDPRLEAPPARPGVEAGRFEDLGLDGAASDSQFRAPGESNPVFGEEISTGGLARFWVDTQSLQVQRIDRADGVFVIFGPIVSFDRIKVPSWFEIHDPEEVFPMRFEIERAVQVNAPPKAFDRGWLIPSDQGRDDEIR